MKKILIVGPCYADAKALKKRLESTYSVETHEVTKISEAKAFLQQRSCDLIFVTRVCSGDKKPGLELIKYVKTNCPDKPIIFLSRFPEAQKEALEAGAKAALDMDLLIGFIRPSMAEKQKEALREIEKCIAR